MFIQSLSGRFFTATASDSFGNTSEVPRPPSRSRSFIRSPTRTIAVRCSLSQAILDANANSGLDAILFDIPGSGVHTIHPTSTLPLHHRSDPHRLWLHPTRLQSQHALEPARGPTPSFRWNSTVAAWATWMVRGSPAGASASTIRGLAINRFEESGINLNDVSSVRIAGQFHWHRPDRNDRPRQRGRHSCHRIPGLHQLFNWRLPARGPQPDLRERDIGWWGRGHFLLLRRSKQHHG